jgi:hypothetical protein
MSTFRTSTAATSFARRHDLDGVFVVEGKGDHARPYLLADAGVAEDLLADDLGRAEAKALLQRISAAGRYVVALGDYCRA